MQIIDENKFYYVKCGQQLSDYQLDRYVRTIMKHIRPESGEPIRVDNMSQPAYETCLPYLTDYLQEDFDDVDNDRIALNILLSKFDDAIILFAPHSGKLHIVFDYSIKNIFLNSDNVVELVPQFHIFNTGDIIRSNDNSNKYEVLKVRNGGYGVKDNSGMSGFIKIEDQESYTKIANKYKVLEPYKKIYKKFTPPYKIGDCFISRNVYAFVVITEISHDEYIFTKYRPNNNSYLRKQHMKFKEFEDEYMKIEYQAYQYMVPDFNDYDYDYDE